MNLLNYLSIQLDGIVVAVLLLILAFIVSAVVKKLVVKLLNKTNLKGLEEKALGSSQEGGAPQKEGLVSYFGKLAYLLVFLLFIPGIFSALGVSAVSDPISTLLQTVWGYIPNIIAAVVVLVAGTLIAKLVRELLIPVFQRLRVDKLQDKAGIEVKDEARLSVTLAYIVYVLIIIPVIIAALQALRISVITNPAVSMLQRVLNFIPNIVVALILILVGTRVAKFTGQIVRQLIAASGADEKVREMVGESAPKFTLSNALGMVVCVVLDIFFVVEGLNVFKLDVLTNVGEHIIAYLPNVLAAVLIVIAAFLLSSAAERAMTKGGLKQYAVITRAAILIVGAFMVLNQLGIASTIVNFAFIIILVALGIAFAVSFGLGGRDFASNMMGRLEEKLTRKKDEE